MPDKPPPESPSSAPKRTVSPRVFTDAIPHVAELGIEPVEAEGGAALLRLPWQERLVGNPETGVLHGGVITTLIDTASGLAAITSLPGPQPIATLDLRIDYLRPATPRQDIFARAEAYKVTRQIVFIRASAFQDGPDDLVATAVGTFMQTGRLGPRAPHEQPADRPSGQTSSQPPSKS
jgi:uncharacterized protein (TIGR00369 family)